jgi:probable rRNA maturation factor
MVLNQQSKRKVDLAGPAALVRRLEKILGLRGQRFNVCFVDDEQICALNAAHRKILKPTDVLSFPWTPKNPRAFERPAGVSDPNREFEGFLGDIVISVETARRNAQAEGHAPETEISCLILHGLLHLVGMDHEKDCGEMAALEHDLRGRLGLEGKRIAPRAGS